MTASSWPDFGSARWPRRRIAALGAGFIALVIGLTVYDGIDAYRQTERDALGDLDGQARIVAEQTSRSLQSIDLVLRVLAAERAAGSWAAMDAERLQRHLQQQAAGMTQIINLGVVDRDGKLVATSSGKPGVQPPPDVGTDPRFQELQKPGMPPLVIGGAFFSPFVDEWVFPVSVTLRDADGAFDGAVAALGRIDEFQRFYGEAFPDPSLRVSLLTEDATLLARRPPDPQVLGRRFPLAGELAASAAAGQATARVKSPFDGAEVFTGTAKVPGYPLVVVIARDVDSVFAEWHSRVMRSMVRTLVLAALAWLLIVLVLRQLGRLDAARLSLVASEQRYALAAAGSNEGLWDWDLTHDLLYMSPRAQVVALGRAGEPLRASAAWLAAMRIHADDLPKLRAAGDAHLRGDTPHVVVEFRVHHDGDPPETWHWCRQRGIAQRDAEGHPVRLAGSVEDITPRKDAEAAQQRLEAQLRQAQKLEAIGTLAGGIAHDFNNILAAILGFGELARKDAPEGSAQRAHIDASIAAGTRAKSLVERILAFSRTGMGERQPVHVQSVVADTFENIDAVLPPGITLERRLEAGDAGVLGDPTQIHQVVMNLCANAVQAIAPPGTVAVGLDVIELAAPLAVATRTLPPGRYLRLAVRDTGAGMQPGIVERIFDPFFTTKEIGVGTGLGLSLVHGIVADLDGGIAVESQVGVGSTFTVYLASRLDVTPPLPAHTAEPAPQVPQGTGQTVLLVDDEPALIQLGEEALASLGYEPAAFTSSAAALAAFRADPQRFDLLLSDEAMPGLTGTELAVELRALRPELPVVLMSGFVTPALHARARRLGVAAVLDKPLDWQAVAASLADALNLHPHLRTPEA